MKIYKSINDKIINEIVDVLNSDGLIIFPTDTVYGIACNAFSDKALIKLFNAKKRSFDKPINVLTNSIDKILTIILNKKKGISNILTANKNTIGVRIPNNEVALKILSNYPYPLAVTSANISGFNVGTKLDDLIDIFKDKVDVIIDGGILKSIPSTIVRIENNNINILRQGNLKIEL